MKTRFLLSPLTCLTLLAFCMISTSWGTLVTFDELSETTTGSFIANGYQGLNWTNFVRVNIILNTINNGLSGAYYGMVTPSNVVLNAFGDPAEIDSRGTNFNFLSTYLTGVWRSNLNIEVQGFNSGTLLYSTTVVASATSPALFTFSFLNIDRLAFSASGGQYAGFGSDAETFAMDNFTFELVPEPSSLLLTTAGALLLCPLLKRKKMLTPSSE